jgi:molybdenum cofactor cytidylyltransferase
MKVAAIILAAGESRRMGRPKQTLPFGGSTILGNVVAALQVSRVRQITVVLGYHAAETRGALAGSDVSTTVNPAPERGMLSSAQWGLSQLSKDFDAYLFALGDQPHITRDVVDRLIEVVARSDRGIILPAYQGKRGHPLLVDAGYRDEILNLPLTGGLNQLLDAHPDDILLVPVETATIHEDIDTPEDYERATRPGHPC